MLISRACTTTRPDASTTARPTRRPGAPSIEIAIDVEPPATEREWAERRKPSAARRAMDWPLLVLVTVSAALGAATWLGLAQLGVT